MAKGFILYLYRENNLCLHPQYGKERHFQYVNMSHASCKLSPLITDQSPDPGKEQQFSV